jgi:hypothetical protein
MGPITVSSTNNILAGEGIEMQDYNVDVDEAVSSQRNWLSQGNLSLTILNSCGRLNEIRPLILIR